MMNTAPSQFALVAAIHADYEDRAAAQRVVRTFAARREHPAARRVRRRLDPSARRVLIGREGHVT
jgi:hypothetical protein